MGPQFDGSCVSVGLPLSVIELASRYGSLANLLCGLALGAVAFMLGKKEAAPPHTIALLSSGVIVLAADSFYSLRLNHGGHGSSAARWHQAQSMSATSRGLLRCPRSAC